jgi:hypothetical protein
MAIDLDLMHPDADDTAATLAALEDLLTDPDLSSEAVHIKCLERLDGPAVSVALARLRRQQQPNSITASEG